MESRPIKYCRVCGDKASGFNYKGLCCKSCKVFFLRNAKYNELICFKYGNCKIDVFTRKDCAKCRLDKCFSAGMVMKSCSKNQSQSSQLDIHMRNVLQFNNFDLPNPQYLNLPQLPYILTRKTKISSVLIASERSLIANVQSVASETFVDESRLRIIGQVSRLADTFQHFALYTRKIVQFCKSIPAFRQLNTNDQLLLLKSSFYEILITRFVYVLDRDREGFPVIENECATQAMFVKFDLLSEFKNQELIQLQMKFQKELYDEMESDFTIRDLLIAIHLFKPRAHLSRPEFVHYQFALYCRLLRRYLEHKYKNVTKSVRKYHKLIQLADEFDYQKSNSRHLVQSEMNVKQIPQIIVEIMDF